METALERPNAEARVPASDRSRSVGALLSRVLEEGVVSGNLGENPEAINDPAVALLGGPDRYEQAWRWICERIDRDLANLSDGDESADGCWVMDVELPRSLGGAPLRITASVVDEDADGRRHVMVLLRDRLALDRLQDDLRFALQMRRRALSLENAAHDLKAPLNALALNLDLLRRDLRKADVSAEATQRLDVLELEIARLNDMVQKAMAQFRMPEAVVCSFDLAELARETIELVRPQAEPVNVTLDLALPDTDVPVLGVRDHLEQALVNLLVNGIEAMSSGGRLFMELTVHDGWADIRVRDEGEGLPEAIAREVFKLHYSTKANGSGLGLFISRSTVERMGGRLELGSAPDGGAIASVILPLAAAGGAGKDDGDPAGPEAERACSTS